MAEKWPYAARRALELIEVLSEALFHYIAFLRKGDIEDYNYAEGVMRKVFRKWRGLEDQGSSRPMGL